MSYTARQLITESYYLTGIVARGFQTVSGDQISDGLRILNNVLADKSFDKRLIPYFSEYTFDSVAGTDKYFIPLLIEPESFTFNIGDIRYPSYNCSRRNFNATARVDNIAGFPFSHRFERVVGGADIYMYFNPLSVYTCKVWGKFGFDSVGLNDDMSLLFDHFYTNYLEYECALFICNKTGVSLSPQTASTLEQYRIKIKDQSPMDLTVTSINRFGGTPGFNLADANIGKGWRP